MQTGLKNYPLSPHNDTMQNLLFWIKEFLVYKLATLNKDKAKPDFDIAKHFKDLRASKSIKEINEVARRVKPSVGAFYNTTMHLVRFYKFVETMNLKQITDITNTVFYDDFLGRYLDKSSQSIKTGNKSAVKMLFDFIELCNIHHSDGSPYLFNITKDQSGKTVTLARLKKHKPVPIWLNENELKKLNKDLMAFTGYKKKTYDFDRARNVLIMKILIYTGITASELVNLKPDNIEEVEAFGKKYIEFSIVGSHNVDRVIPVPRGKIIRYLNAYMKVRNNLANEYLFYGALKKDEQMKTQFVLDMVKDYFEHSGIVKNKITTEILRNTHAILLGNLGAEALYVKERMGHKTLTATKELLKHCNKKLLEASHKFAMTEKYL